MITADEHGAEQLRRARQPKIVDPAHPLVERIRGLCVALPDVVEISAWGRPTFRVAKRIFCVAGSARERPLAVSFKPDPDERLAYLQDARFFVPPYWGTVGWLAIDLDSPATDWIEIGELIETSYREIAPARLVRTLDASLT